MRRREFIALIGGAALARPRIAAAQQAGPQAGLPIVGFLNSATTEGYATPIAAFRQGLAEAGFVEGMNVVIEFRHADGRYDQLPAMVADLIQRRVAVIVATGATAATAAHVATKTIPIVVSSSADPVALGLVTDLARPGGNITGTTRMNIAVSAKRLQLLREMVPAVTTFALLVNPANPILAESFSQEMTSAANSFRVTLHVVGARSEQEIEAVFSTLQKLGAGALIVSADAYFNSQARQLTALASRHNVPTIAQDREFVVAGGLMSYGGNLDDGYRIVGTYTGRILKGENPADMPIQRSTKLGLAINLKTAKALGLDVPPLLLAQADEVIE